MRDLTKWPRLLVAGRAVTEEQANEILVRTDSWHLASNDKAWEAMVYAEAGMALDPRYGWPTIGALREFYDAMGVLDLHYLHNDRIASAWIGGPHGWCSWSGRVGCSTYNIGKWPSHGEVFEDWTMIAEAFPYLDLRAQLITDEGEGSLAGQWTVRDGVVEFDSEPSELIRPVDELEGAQILSVLNLSYNGRERGTDITRLSDALRQVRIQRQVDL